MGRGPSGRIVIEIDAALKHELHAAVALEGITLKQWFLRHVHSYLRDHRVLHDSAPSSDASAMVGNENEPA